MAGHAELADQEDVEGSGQRRGDLERNRNAAARQGQHDNVDRVDVFREPRRELATSVRAIPELHGGRSYAAVTCGVG
jgi:hypothetical protein